jgi:hypothetical protein
MLLAASLLSAGGRQLRSLCCEPGDRIVTAMSAALPTPDAPDVPDVPVTSVAGAIARMEAIGAAFPAGDGLACFTACTWTSPAR